MLCLVAIAVLAVDLEDRVEPPAFNPRAVIYGYPSSTAVMAGGGAVTGDWGLYGVLGTSVRLAERLGLDVEVGGGVLKASRLSNDGWIFSAGLGPSFQLTGDEAFRGLFIATRLRFQVFKPPQQIIFFDASPGQGPIDTGPGTARAFMGELDVGYHFRFGRFYFAPIVGIGVGYAYDYIDESGTRLLQPFGQPSNASRRPQGIVWSLNLNLARLGLAL